MSSVTSQDILHDLGVPRTPVNEEEVYLVRISQKSTSAIADHAIMRSELVTVGKDAKWDSVKGNKVRVGDWMGFIIGDSHSESVELYQVAAVKGPEHRPSHWNRIQYTCQKVTENVSEREVVIFKKRQPLVYDWGSWKKDVEYKPLYMPRGTIRARHPW